MNSSQLGLESVQVQERKVRRPMGIGVAPEGMWAEYYILFTCGGSQTPESEFMLGCFAGPIMACGCPGPATLEGKDSQNS